MLEVLTMFKEEMLKMMIAITTKNNVWFTNFSIKMIESSNSPHCPGFQLPYQMEKDFSISNWGKMRTPLEKRKSMNHAKFSNLLTHRFKMFLLPLIHLSKNKWKSAKANKILSKIPTRPCWGRRCDRFSWRTTTPIFNRCYSYCNKSTIKIKG